MKNRYPGVRPFTQDEQNLFFGRDEDIVKFHNLLNIERMVVLYSKSGFGKSSLINAGIIPRLKTDTALNYFTIRLGSYTKEAIFTPAQIVNEKTKFIENPENRDTIQRATVTDTENRDTLQRATVTGKTALHKIAPDDKSLWYHFKTMQLNTGEATQLSRKKILLFFDQFEELFSYPDEQITDFKAQLAELLFTTLPERFNNALTQTLATQADALTDAEIDSLYEPLQLKVVFIIRSDRMSLLNKLSSHIPGILKKCYELSALTREQAKNAIVMPAQKQGEFVTPVFQYQKPAIDTMLNYLTRENSQPIETTQLQILCQYCEEIIQKTNDTTISESDLGNIETIFTNYYDNLVHRFPEKDQQHIRKFIEDQLIQEERRISLDKVICLRNIHEDILQELVNTHLLRSEPNTTGGISYELSHDTLIAPILKAREVRVTEEKKNEELRMRNEELRIAREKAEKERIEREKERKRQRTIIYIVSVAALISVSLGIFGMVNWLRAKEKTKIANEQAGIANEQTKNATKSEQAAKEALLQVKEKQKDLEIALKKAEESQNFAEQEKIKAELAKNKAEQLAFGLMPPEAQKDQFGYFWKKGKQSLADFNYSQAYTELLMAKNAANLPPGMSDSANAMYSEAEWYNRKYKEATGYFYDTGKEGNYAKAKPLFEEIVKRNRKDSLTWFYAKASANFQTEDMVLVESGTLERLSDGDSMIVKLNNYYISKYETTNAQYARFLNDFVKFYENKPEYIDSIQKIFIDLAGSSGEMRQGIYYENSKYKVYFSYENRPVAWVSWYGADAFCRFYGLKLPSEAQWEFAARGGNKSQGYEYSGSADINEVAEYYNNNGKRTKGVGGKKCNELGLYDMSGNLWEWCYDKYDSYHKGYFTDYVNAVKADDGSRRVYRGGSWRYSDGDCRVAYRGNWYPDYRCYYVGFRPCFVP